MAIKKFWIQIENNPWDVCPNNIDRYTGQTIEEVAIALGITKTPLDKELYSSVTNIKSKRKMYWPVDALILRRYTENWGEPDDRKVNPWDINEPDPSNNGTMGTIPGPVIECDVGDEVIVHFRNMDMRTDSDGNLLNIHERAHSLHPHGFVFETKYDGAFPLSPPDRKQPVDKEKDLWKLVGVTDLKKGDRVPAPATDDLKKRGPDIGINDGDAGTFIYTWNTFHWPTTAGVWLYHDHSICDHHNVLHGAIGIIVINNPKDPDYMPEQDLPDGLSHNSSPIEMKCIPFDPPVPTLPHDINKYLGAHPPVDLESADLEMNPDDPPKWRIGRGSLQLDLSNDDKMITQVCIPRYRKPPEKARYLQLYHELTGAEMLINGRKFMGNTPTLIGGPTTKMRFGVVGMNNDAFHTFHLHGHRWVIPGPAGNNPGGGNGPESIENSPLINAASQFEDTKLLGPANSFSFTINQGTFMGPPKGAAFGEWHMHCHVLGHMMTSTMGGMMGSLLVVQGGELALGLPMGEPCPADLSAEHGHEPAKPVTNGTVTENMGNRFVVVAKDNSGTKLFDPSTLNISVGDTVEWQNKDPVDPHTSTNLPDGNLWNIVMETFDTKGERKFDQAGTYEYKCNFHQEMKGKIIVKP